MIRNQFSTREIPPEEFEQKMDELAETQNRKSNLNSMSSSFSRNMFIQEAAMLFAIEKAEFLGIEYSKIEIDNILNNPVLRDFERYKPVIVNFALFVSIPKN